MYKKEKKLLGLFYKKTNLLNSESIIRFLGLKILYSKVDILKSSASIYIYPFKFLSFKKNIRKNIQRNYMEYVLYKYPNYKNYIIFSSGFGEIYHTLFYLKQIINRDNISDNTLIVFNKKGLNDLYKLFNINFDSTVIESIEGIMLDKTQEYKGAKFITPLNFDYFGTVEKSICNHKAHYYEVLKSNIFFDLNCDDISIPNLKDNFILGQFLENGLKKHFVIICPEASTLNFLPYDFWMKLVQKLKFAGYEVLVNTNNSRLTIENSISSWKVGLSVEEILQLSKYAEAIIGLRSGFLEILTDISQTKTFIIYQDFNCFAQNNLSAEDVLSGFSVKKLPNIKSELIHEYKFNTYNDFENLIDEILSNLSKKKDANCLLETKLPDNI